MSVNWGDWEDALDGELMYDEIDSPGLYNGVEVDYERMPETKAVAKIIKDSYKKIVSEVSKIGRSVVKKKDTVLDMSHLFGRDGEATYEIMQHLDDELLY